MNRGFKIGATILALAALGLIGWQVASLKEPSYQGKPLSVWLESLNDPPGSGPSGSSDLKMLYGGWNSGWTKEKGDTVKQAIHHMGMRAVPALRSMIRFREPPLRLKLKALVEKQKLIKFHFKSESEIHLEAAAGCQLAEPVIKTQLIKDWMDFRTNQNVDQVETRLRRNDLLLTFLPARA